MKKIFSFIFCAIILLNTSAFSYDQENSMVKISGQYGTSMSFETDSWDWKNANGDYQERNWRYVFGNDGVNTYDPRIFSRFQTDITTNTKTPWNFGMQIKVDPWSWTGIGSEKVVSSGGAFGTYNNDTVNVEYLYWSNNSSTLNRTFRTSWGNFLSTPEQKVLKRHIYPASVASGFNFSGAIPSRTWQTTLSENRKEKIDYFFRPVRKLWGEYNDGDLYVKVFALGDQWEAYKSDDPLKLSDNRAYWAPSAWTWSWDPGMDLLNRLILPDPVTFQRAKWNWDLQWHAEDSNRNYLTYLRGMLFKYNYEDTITFDMMVASPMTPWQEYDDVDSVPMIARLKWMPDDKLTLGFTNTSKFGINKKKLQGFNNVGAIDINYEFAEDTNIFGQYAINYIEIKHPRDIIQKNVAYAYTLGLNGEKFFKGKHRAKWDFSVTSMGRDFDAGLSDYRDTRIDRDWGRHILFESLSWDDQQVRIGNSIDTNRFVVGANAKLNLYDDLLDFYFNWRNARAADTGKFIENITRFEATFNPLQSLQIKALALHRAYPDTISGKDPILRDRYTDEFYNAFKADGSLVPGGKDVQIATFSLGAKTMLWDDKITLYGVYEATNDPQDFPRRELRDFSGANSKSLYLDQHGITSYELIPFLYSQDLFSLPPYRYYNVIKGSVSVTPVENVTLKYTIVHNTNKNYAALFDQNNTHQSIDLYYKPVDHVSVYAGYTYSQLIDLKRAIDTSGAEKRYRGHHNIYAQVNWLFPDDQKLTIQWGETWFPNQVGDMFGPAWLSQSASVLDTVHLLRIYFQGKF